MKLKFPHTYVIIFSLILLAAVLTWIFPGGDYVEQAKTVDGKEVKELVFNPLDNAPQTWQVFGAMFKGFVRQAGIIVLILMIGVILVYTGIVGTTHGWNLAPVFFGDIAAMNWPGQFNLDFSCLLALSGLWLAWRHQFSPAGVALGLLGSVGGTLVLAPYLLFASFQAKGDVKALLLGKNRTTA